MLCVALIVSSAAYPARAGQPANSTAPHEQDRISKASDRILQEGSHSRLPPHISTLLGLSQEKEVAVRQGVLHSGNIVQGFDVVADNSSDIVLFVVDESTNSQTLYLTSPEGSLRKVVAVKAGVGTEARISDDDRKGFQKEKKFWLDRLVGPTGTK
jgi:hypothetical protein